MIIIMVTANSSNSTSSSNSYNMGDSKFTVRGYCVLDIPRFEESPND